ncbi:putative molybdenum carrier protein [Crateriforma spongiae]|uniref:putative molybdenum carrier protein n=1 Tax=Crateriforma spongiae TaxID=2724528 RepID=UPI0014469A76|nr:putative molybdenum carrier protein [Crateriforma spongiae]
MSLFPSDVVVPLPRRIVSGGQTGVDRAGLDVAIDLGLEHGGWCPAGRLAEDGRVPSRYHMTEHRSPMYPPRTEQNVIDSDATLILYLGKLSGGTLLTKRLADKHRKPAMTLKLNSESMDRVRRWLADVRPETLNVAGPRESSCPGIERSAAEFLHQVFSDPNR